MTDHKFTFLLCIHAEATRRDREASRGLAAACIAEASEASNDKLSAIPMTELGAAAKRLVREQYGDGDGTTRWYNYLCKNGPHPDK